MKTMLCCAFMWVLPYGVLCEPVWAEDTATALPPAPITPCGVNRPIPGFTEVCDFPYAYVYDDTTKLWDAARDPKCLAKMEAAMRAMEPWLLKPKTTRKPNGDEVMSLTDWHGVKNQWDVVKAECWKDQK